MSRLSERPYDKRGLSLPASPAHSSRSSTRATEAARRNHLSFAKGDSATRRKCASEGGMREKSPNGGTSERIDKWRLYAKDYVAKEFQLGKYEARDKWQDHVDSVLSDEDFLLRAEKSISEESTSRRSTQAPSKVSRKKMGCIKSKTNVVDDNEDAESSKTCVEVFYAEDSSEDSSDEEEPQEDHKTVSRPETLVEVEEEEDDDEEEDENSSADEAETSEQLETILENQMNTEDKPEVNAGLSDIGDLIAGILMDGKTVTAEAKKEEDSDSSEDVDAAIEEILKEGVEETKADISDDSNEEVDAALREMEEEKEKARREEDVKKTARKDKEHEDIVVHDNNEIETNQEEQTPVAQNIECSATESVENSDLTIEQPDERIQKENMEDPSPEHTTNAKEHRRKSLTAVTLPEEVLDKLEVDIIDEHTEEERKKEEEREKLDELIKDLALE